MNDGLGDPCFGGNGARLGGGAGSGPYTGRLLFDFGLNRCGFDRGFGSGPYMGGCSNSGTFGLGTSSNSGASSSMVGPGGGAEFLTYSPNVSLSGGLPSGLS